MARLIRTVALVVLLAAGAAGALALGAPAG